MSKIFKRRWFMLDMARQRTFEKEEFLMILDILVKMGYNGIGLYLEGAFEFKSIPGVIRKGVMSYEDAEWVVCECEKRNIFVFPMTNVVAHMEHFFLQERFRYLKKADCFDQLDFYNTEAEAFAMQILREYTTAFRTDMVHLGGDETHLTQETKSDYARFLAKLCDNLLEEGIQPAIWDDMIWMDKPLCEPFSRNVLIFDWNYFGHRPESIRYFHSLGFKELVVCPSDDSWEGVINYQRVGDHLDARTDIPVKPDEIEAFLVDEVENGDPENLGALITNWENKNGSNLWAQWAAYARAGLFMTGNLTAGEQNDELIEMTLFGHVTPYTEVTHMLQAEVSKENVGIAWPVRIRTCLYSVDSLCATVSCCINEEPDFAQSFYNTLDRIEEKLLGWSVKDEFEKRCLSSMNSVVAMTRAGISVIDAFSKYKRFYGKAAEIQFENTEVASQLVICFVSGIRTAVTKIMEYRDVFEITLSGTGHTKNDLLRLENMAQIYCNIAEKIEESVLTISTIPLPNIEKTIENVIRRRVIGV